MKLHYGLHLAYCTNIHRGEDWAETFDSLQKYTLAVRQQVSPNKPYAIGLRLSDAASRTLAEPKVLHGFKGWLEASNCYVFTINGFPYGKFHGTRVKEQVYLPDWTSPDRLAFTNRLFDILSELLPNGVEGSVSTVPCSFKEFITGEGQVDAMCQNLWKCVDHIQMLNQRTGKLLHLGLEPEPLCYLETSAETVTFFERMRKVRRNPAAMERFLGVNYDTCHLAAEFEEARDVVNRFRENRIRISKIHISSALKVRPTPETRKALQAFADDIYFHQVIEKSADGKISRYRDLDVALADKSVKDPDKTEWRIHFHIPLHSPATPLFGNTSDHIIELFDQLRNDPPLCSHLEMETYTWEVMPPELKGKTVVDQLVSEYRWTLAKLTQVGLA
jgi:hypothetical protein